MSLDFKKLFLDVGYSFSGEQHFELCRFQHGDILDDSMK